LSGGAQTVPVTLTINPNCNFFASQNQITLPQTTTLSWNCKNVNSCSIDNGIGSVDSSGSTTVSPTKTTTYTLSCDKGSYAATVNVGSSSLMEINPLGM